MFYFGAVVGAALGYIAAIFTPGVIAYLRSGYFAKVHQVEGYGKSIAGQVQKGL